jgi:CDP-glucose 4,6-dehydratase
MGNGERAMEKLVMNRERTFWQDRRVFVTGGTGLVGAWTIDALLDAGAHVVALIKDADPQSELFRSGNIQRLSVVNGKLEDFFTLEQAINLHEIDTVFHLGAQTLVQVAHRFPLQTFEANIRGTYNLLEVCRLHRDLVQRIVIASSDKAYGAAPQLPYTEEMPLNAKHPYEVSKSCTDMLAQSYAHTYGLPIGITRFGNVYGGGDLNWSRIVPGSIRSFLRRERPIIRSDGSFIRDYIYVKDVVAAYLCLAEALPQAGVSGEAFNFSTESPISVLDLVSSIQQLMGCEDIELDIRNSAQGEIQSQYLCVKKAKTVLGWQPIFDLDAGLQATIEWYRNFINKGKP